jgi:hypothetical protein
MSTRSCIHVKTNGVQCGSPALRKSTHCHFHHKHRRVLKRGVVLDTLHTRQGRLGALSHIVHALIGNRIDPEIARSLLYAIQTSPTPLQ